MAWTACNVRLRKPGAYLVLKLVKNIFNQHKFQHFHLQLRSDRIQQKFRSDPDPTFKKDCRSDLDPQKKDPIRIF